ncbi:hypothetical protein KD909_12650 [Exiguobacterium sp. PFWT01]|uniref:hypothetical protein n=1 Tax=Exiguobacterium sp. PFWT01 TaxID=2829816 RepID=UPI001BA9287A|nr:hypothetical protein [Exiguobacterium sp. PFWT01]QUP86763.1 hypothetical protein KD909_12650 [Exiguobacterium sp. PFWT01]
MEQDVKWMRRMRRYAIPILILYVTAIIVALLLERMWLIPIMVSVSVIIVVMGYQEMRIMWRMTENPKAHRILIFQYVFEWVDAILLTALMVTLLTTGDFGLMIGLFFGIWGVLSPIRQKWFTKKLNQIDPELPTYEEVLEGGEDIWNYHQK